MLSLNDILKVAKFEAQYGKSEATFSPQWNEDQRGPEQTFSPSWHENQQRIHKTIDEARDALGAAHKLPTDGPDVE